MSGRDASPASSALRSGPVPVHGSPRAQPQSSPSQSSPSRATSIARLQSPPRSNGTGSLPPIPQIPTPTQLQNNRTLPTDIPLPGAEDSSALPGPGESALAAAFRNSLGTTPPISSPPLRPLSPTEAGLTGRGSGQHTTYGSFDQRISQGGEVRGGNSPFENAEIVKRHLVLPSEASSSKGHDNGKFESGRRTSGSRGQMSQEALKQSARKAVGFEDAEFSSLQLQGGDITRQVYRWTEEAEALSNGKGRVQRSHSFNVLRPQPESEVLDINNIKVPGGFRRNFLRRAADDPSVTHDSISYAGDGRDRTLRTSKKPKLLTSSFLEFLSLYGHFAGEELEEDDEVLEPDEYFSSDTWDDPFGGYDDDQENREPGEDSALLTPGTPGKRRRRRKERGVIGTNTAWGAFLLLLKSFVGTGVLFLPKAFLNGGMLFSNLVLLGVASLSYYCFILLVSTRLKIDGSFGDIGGLLYGKYMRGIILFSIVLSQIGFAAAYIVFTSQNLQAFILAVSHCRTMIDIKYMILMQLVIFLPLSLIRDISKLGATALIADLMILLGLIYLYYYDIFTLISNHGVSDIALFNPRDWTLFIGTAIFTFEGIGLIIPIQESMRKPQQFPPVLAGVMILITVVFVSMGALSYAAYGSNTKTVVILNLPQGNKFVNGVQFLYSLAILLSTPLQLFPAIRITENELFTRSGKYNPYIKWQKNVFRFCLVMLTTVIAWGGANDLDKFVALVGSFACVPLVYVYPPLLHLKAVARNRFHLVSDLFLCVFGFVVMIYTTTLTIQSWAKAGPPKSPGYCDRPEKGTSSSGSNAF